MPRRGGTTTLVVGSRLCQTCSTASLVHQAKPSLLTTRVVVPLRKPTTDRREFCTMSCVHSQGARSETFVPSIRIQ